MSHHEHAPVTNEPVDWEERYAGDAPIWSGQVNGALAAHAADLTPGTALDIGCGEGGDVIWLARHGWAATGIEVASNALRHARAAAAQAGVEATWVHHGLEEHTGSYDLVTACYPAVLRGDGAVIATWLDCVAPGGTLLLVHHANIDLAHALERGFDPREYVGITDLAAAVTEAGWEVLVNGEFERDVPADSPGSHHHHDEILLARRPG